MPPAAIGAMVGLGALGGASDARRARRAHEEGTREDHTVTRSPYGPSVPYRDDLLERVQGQGHQGALPWNVPTGNIGPGRRVRDQAEALWGRARSPSELTQDAGGYASSLLGGQDTNPYRSGLARALQGYQGPGGISQFLQHELGGFGSDRWSAYGDPRLPGAPGPAAPGGGQVTLPMPGRQSATKPGSPAVSALPAGPLTASKGPPPQARPGAPPVQHARGAFSYRGSGSPAGRRTGRPQEFGTAGLSGEVGGHLRDVIQGRFADSQFQDALRGASGGAPSVYQDRLASMMSGATTTPYQDRINSILSGEFLSGSPLVDRMIDMEQRRVTDRFNREVMPGIDQAAEAHGRFRGGEQAKAEAMGGLAQSLGDIGTQFRFQDYNARMGDLMDTLRSGLQDYRQGQGGQRELLGMGLASEGQDRDRQLQAIRAGLANERGVASEILQGLGLASGRDVSAMDDATRRHGIDTSADTARASISASRSSAARAANAAREEAAAERAFRGEQSALDRALNQRLSEQGMMLDSLGLMSGAQQFGLGLTGDLAGGFSRDQAGAAGLAAELGNQDFGNMLGAFGAGFDVDAARRGGARDARNDAIDRFRYEAEAPWDALMREAQMLEMLTGGYGTERRQGVTRTPYTGPSSLGGGISGAMGILGMLGGMGGFGGG